MEPKENAINPDFLKPYSPQDNEKNLYKKWEESGYFNPDVCIERGITASDAETFSIVLPPPNVTGVLHMGHAAMLAVEDLLVRYHRMLGKRTLWIPGTDSAAIATQSKVEGEIYKKEKKTRHDIGRDELLKRVGEFAEASKDTIISQTKSMGSSLDWSRYAYTLDETRYKAVMEAFMRMYDAGLIYRGERIVNWDPKGQTTISDDEIVHEERKEKFYYLKYGPFTIGTSRPETKFGDKYVVMHPDDARYKEYEHGQTLELEWINGPITATVIKDEAIDMEFGTGVMTITPWHDATDFEIAGRHNLDKEQVIDERGILLPIAGEFAGQHIKKARENILEKLRSKGLLEKEEDYTHNVSTAERTGEVIEPQIKAQWFIAVNKKVEFPDGRVMTLKERMREAVEGEEIKIAPDRFNKTYYHWIDNLRDWNISRQIWFGHRVPAWFTGNEVKVQIESPGEGWEQDPDTLDTWFSSGLWTFSTLGWPEETADFKTYHPTTVLETGYDILFFWVARMILMSTFLVGEVPFKNVYLHGMVRDGKGQKMSKSKGNIIDPLDMIEKYGADATRLSLVVGAAPGNDVPLSEDKIRGYKHFANKLWNISRFVLTNTEGKKDIDKSLLSPRDQEILDGFYTVAKEVGDDIEKFGLYLAADKAYHYVWDELAAKILEESKPILNGDDSEAKQARQQVLIECLIGSLKLLHPFMPFVTEAVWQRLPEDMKDTEFLMVAKWPTKN
ncbi:valine--tRNA ligase [Candidatus Nomurabacteria bacterium]|nr:valine--tRNA ligase [Candidatus Nomurabacteria bacterium]MCB9819417.1 valine--tRNA ligase [Candidatus Nomurabacteria bacterium]